MVIEVVVGVCVVRCNVVVGDCLVQCNVVDALSTFLLSFMSLLLSNSSFYPVFVAEIVIFDVVVVILE